MPNQATPTSPRFKGIYHDQVNGRIALVYNGTEAFDFDGNDIGTVHAFTSAGAMTAGTTLAVTGVSTLSDEVRIANGKNLRIGTISAFATTEPTNAIVMRGGTEFAGAITTAGGIMSSSTVLRKIIADGTVSNVG